MLVEDRWIGIDFSGDHSKWGVRRKMSNIWIAQVRLNRHDFELCDLRRVQELDGSEPPFLRLARFLREQPYRAAAVDAPFSIPIEFVAGRKYAQLLDTVGCMKVPRPRLFPEAHHFVKEVTGQGPPVDPPKPLRVTEIYWRQRGVYVRSTLWAGARGGAPMTAACMKLLALTEQPIWPWSPGGTVGLLVEGFPAAQLKHWGLPHQRYDHTLSQQNAARRVRREIVKALERRARLARFTSTIAENADALDSVLCAFGAIAVSTGVIALPVEGKYARKEGWIAVHR